MNVEIICVGTELLLGDIVNTNATYLSQRLAEMGFNVFSQSVVGDNAARLQQQLSLSMSRSELVILTGGLGPTNDDITKETVASVLQLPLIEHPESLRRIERYFSRTGRTMSESNKKQALTIQGATVFPNEHGTAPGYFVETQTGGVILLPGPPSELIPMFEEQVTPLLSKYSNRTIQSHNVRVFGIGESVAAERCGELLEQENPTVATYAKAGEVDIRVTAAAESHAEAERLMEPVLEELDAKFGSHIYGIDVASLQETVVGLLREKKLKLATAESCTAGMLSGRITEIPGASEVFEMGVTAYANYIKIQALGVDEKLIADRGAVCAEVAAQMAVGIRSMCNADLGVGITGVAGPGESEGKPAGLVYIALADREMIFVRKILCRGNDRENTRIIATSTALDMVRRHLQSCEDLLACGTAIGAPLQLMEGYSLPDYQPKSQDPKPEDSLRSEELQDMFHPSDAENKENGVEPAQENQSMEFIFDDDYRMDTILAAKQPNVGEAVGETAAKKKNFFTGLLPVKEDPLSEKIRKSVFLVAFVVLICTMAYLVNYFVEGWLQSNIVSDAAKTWQSDDSMEKNEDGIFIGFESLMEANSDIRAWIKIDGTNINNPVYQTNNNDYYVSHNMNKESSRYGALFLDKDNIIGEKTNSQNVIVYGHHMRDGTMFGPLKNYTDLEFYKEHSVIDFTTLYQEGQYKIFSVFITNTLAEHDDGEVFDYCVTDFSGEKSFLRFVNEVKKRSIIDTGVDVVATDELLTLSTCTYEFDDARLVVVARRVREDETKDEIANTDDAKVNPNPMYPAIWYTKKGLTKPDFSDSSEVSSTETSSQIVSDPILDGSSSDVLSGASVPAVVDPNVPDASTHQDPTATSSVEDPIPEEEVPVPSVVEESSSEEPVSTSDAASTTAEPTGTE